MSKSVKMWSLEKTLLLANTSQFLFIDKKEGIPDYRLISVMNAGELWENDTNVVFLTKYRLAGLVDNIYDFLDTIGVDENSEIVDDIFSKRFDGNEDDEESLKYYNNEVLSYQKWHLKTYKDLSLNGDSIDELIDEKKDFEKKIQNKVIVTPRKGFDLMKRIEELTDDKVLDVSKMDSTGKGARATVMPKKTKKILVPGLPIISDNIETYKYALEMLPGGINAYEDVLIKFRKLLGKDSKYDDEDKIRDANEKNKIPTYLKPELFRNKKDSEYPVKPFFVPATDVSQEFEEDLINKHWMKDISEISRKIRENEKIASRILEEHPDQESLDAQNEALKNIDILNNLLKNIKLNAKLEENRGRAEIKAALGKEVKSVKEGKNDVLSKDDLKGKSSFGPKKISKSPIKVIPKKKDQEGIIPEPRKAVRNTGKF